MSSKIAVNILITIGVIRVVCNSEFLEETAHLIFNFYFSSHNKLLVKTCVLFAFSELFSERMSLCM